MLTFDGPAVSGFHDEVSLHVHTYIHMYFGASTSPMYLRAGSCVLVRRFRLRCPSPHKDEVATFHFSNEV